ncbi:hypothetical protein [Acinetobacter bereziniae]|uniref:hypothetical protein n=1 Tax=Acinetobacter bereziniae TaxID=106648 RepID=UPI001902A753|nr:hypothetical protein [Acinetobacter bereziniae]MBJ9902043.1 hypothetical protein [Acinetobacter bereziniae]MCU4317934.1 hypothetical protein [Acinetobacter bereziniae]MCU4597748.1 hypothetical protein [Acinetobacter bereziniae]
MNIDLLYFSILLNIFLTSVIIFTTFEKISFIKKRKFSKAKLRLNKHINERKKLIKEIRNNFKSVNKKKTIYGYPWWPWFK